jgi:hypothetical protein
VSFGEKEPSMSAHALDRAGWLLEEEVSLEAE